MFYKHVSHIFFKMIQLYRNHVLYREKEGWRNFFWEGEREMSRNLLASTYDIICKYIYVTVSGKTGLITHREMLILNIQGVVACQWW